MASGRSLELECAKVFHVSLLVPVLIYGSETVIWREKGRSRIRDVQRDKLRGLLSIRRMDKVQNARIRELCEVTKVVDEIGLMKVFSVGSPTGREWRKTEVLCRGVCL